MNDYPVRADGTRIPFERPGLNDGPTFDFAGEAAPQPAPQQLLFLYEPAHDNGIHLRFGYDANGAYIQNMGDPAQTIEHLTLDALHALGRAINIIIDLQEEYEREALQQRMYNGAAPPLLVNLIGQPYETYLRSAAKREYVIDEEAFFRSEGDFTEPQVDPAAIETPLYERLHKAQMPYPGIVEEWVLQEQYPAVEEEEV